MQLAIRIPSTQPFQENVVRAYVVFIPGRGSARAVSNRGGMQRGLPPPGDRERFPNVASYAASKASGESLANGIELIFSFRYERPVPAFVILELVDQTRWRLIVEPVHLVASAADQQGGDVESLLMGPKEFLKQLWDSLDCEKVPAGCFFADLDRRTHPQLVDACHQLFPAVLPSADLLAVKLAVSSLMIALREQLLARTGAKDEMPRRTYLHKHLRNHAQYISRLFLRLARHYFPDSKTGGIDVAKFEAAFEMFALGELKVALPNGVTATQPSSGYFVFFAEIAFFCYISGIDAAEWTPLINVLVRAQEPFFIVHTRSDGAEQSNVDDYGPHTFDALAARNYRLTGQVASLKTAYATKTTGNLATSSSDLVDRYLPDLVASTATADT